MQQAARIAACCNIYTDWRMAGVVRLLHETGLKLAAIADRVGYQSEFAFAKAFKRVRGIAPGAYRLQLPG